MTVHLPVALALSLALIAIVALMWIGLGVWSLSRLVHGAEDGRFVPGKTSGSPVYPLGRLHHRLDQVLARLGDDVRDAHIVSSFIAHEMRRPLGGILDRLDRIYMETENTEAQDQIRGVRSRIEAMGDQLNQLMILSGSDVGPRRPCSVSAAARFAVSEMAEKASAKGLYLRASIEDEVSTLADDFNLLTVMLNLIENGIKYTTTGGVTVSVSRIDDSRFAFVCKDSGHGISTEDLMVITMPFYRSQADEAVDGHGLGLGLVRRLTRAYDLSFTIRNRRNGEGAEARIIGPLSQARLSDA